MRLKEQQRHSQEGKHGRSMCEHYMDILAWLLSNTRGFQEPSTTKEGFGQWLMNGPKMMGLALFGTGLRTGEAVSCLPRLGQDESYALS
jgi:hypothetical protein